MSFSEKEKRKLIMMYYRNPETENKKLKEEELETYYSTSCADILKIKKTWKNDVLERAETQLEGCAIFKASADIFLLTAEGKTKAEILQLKKKYLKFLNGETTNDSGLGQLAIFQNVKQQLSRLRCAALVTQAFTEE